MTDEQCLPLVAIVGPTASGKTALAIDLAGQFGGEIICADSRTIYKDMDIGTAKPTPEEQRLVPHWGIDLVQPGARYTAADFKDFADQKIIEIRQRGHIPFLVGGTGLYVDSVIFDYQFGGEPDHELRAELDAFTIEQLHEYCKKSNVILPENKFNKRYVIRAIEKNNQSRSDRVLKESTSVIVGIATDKVILRQRMATRTEQLLTHGVVEEATMLGKKYGWDNQAMTGNIYPLVHSYLLKEITLDELIEKNTTLDWRLAKRQITWLRRNPYIEWADLTGARQIIIQRLASK